MSRELLYYMYVNDKEIVMKKVKVEDMKVWNKEDMIEYWGDWGYEKGEYILKFELGCRGEEELIGKVDVVDGMFEVRDEDDIRIWIKENEEFWMDFEYDEFVSSDFEEWWEGKNVYGECVFEELGFIYVRVKI